METACIKTPLGIATIIGDENGVSVISVADEGEVLKEIPAILQEAVSQLNAYFYGERTANGKNPLWVVVPCHRVIGSDGSLTGYAGGLWRKKWLLEHENPSAQQSLF